MKNHDDKNIHEEEIKNIDEAEQSEESIGIVANCQRLNIRKEPSIDSEVVGVIEVSNELAIDMVNSTDEWFAVCTVDGVEGFCMKMFIELRQ